MGQSQGKIKRTEIRAFSVRFLFFQYPKVRDNGTPDR